MHRTTLLLPALALLPCLGLACGDIAGQNGLDATADGYIPIPLYEAGPPPTFDGFFDAGDAAADVTSEMSPPADAHVEAATDAGMDGPPAEGATDGPHEGASPG